jgi:hypothetical protein
MLAVNPDCEFLHDHVLNSSFSCRPAVMDANPLIPFAIWSKIGHQGSFAGFRLISFKAKPWFCLAKAAAAKRLSATSYRQMNGFRRNLFEATTSPI